MNFQDGKDARGPRDVGIVGAGTMGRGIAQVAAAAGYHVLVYDAHPDRATETISKIISTVKERTKAGKLSADVVETVTSNLSCVDKLEDLKNCAIVLEAIVEDLEIKRRLFASLEAIVSDDCILATNTSSLLVTAIAAGCRAPRRVVGAHFFSPSGRRDGAQGCRVFRPLSGGRGR